MLRVFSLLFISTQIMASVPDGKEGFRGNFDLGLNFTKNTESTFQFSNMFLVKYKIGKSNFILGNNISFISKTGEDDLLNKGTQDFKYALDAKKLEYNITFHHMYDISRFVKNRYTSGLGVSYNFKDEDNRKIGVGLSLIRVNEIPLQGENILQNRLSSNFDLMIKINNNVTLSSTNHYQPNIEKIGDFRLKSNITFRINLSSYFLYSINSIFSYDSIPAEGIPETDYQLINSISYTF